MAQLTLEEARSLARVFGEYDRQKTVLLLLFDKPQSQYQILTKMKDLPKSCRIPRASLYRKVAELCALHFIESVKEREFVKGNLKATVHTYALTLKGRLAGYIYAYVLFLDSKTPDNLRENTDLDNLIATQESMPAWGLYIDFLRWHRERSIDLSHAKVDMSYFGLMISFRMLEKPRTLTEEQLRELSKKMKQIGIAPQHGPREFMELLENAKRSFQEFEERIVVPILRGTIRVGPERPENSEEDQN